MKRFSTRAEATKELKRKKDKGWSMSDDITVRKISKKAHPRAIKRFVVCSYMEWLNHL